MEPLLASLLRRVLPFASHSLYFPTAANTPNGPQWLPRERTLLLPLPRRGEVLGVFTARGVDGRAAKRLLPELPALADLCLDNLELERRGRCDALTGLALGRELLGRMGREADMVRQRFSGGGDEDMGPLHRVCMGLVVVRCRDWHALAAETTYTFAESLLVELAHALTADLPPEALAARTDDDEFTVLLSAGSGGACRRLAAALLPRLDAVSLPHPVTRRPVRLCCAVGHALYPQDMDVALLPLPMEEQARTLLHKARLAAAAAQERFDALLEQDAALGSPHAEQGREARAMAFGRVLAEGGVIRRALPMSRAETSLGRRLGACEGMRFAVWSQEVAGPEAPKAAENADGNAGSRRCKGEIILVEVRDKASVADIVHWTDPADGPDKGDVLRLLPEGGSAASPALSQSLARGQALSQECAGLEGMPCGPLSGFEVTRLGLPDPLPKLGQTRDQDSQPEKQAGKQPSKQLHSLSQKASRKLLQIQSENVTLDMSPQDWTTRMATVLLRQGAPRPSVPNNQNSPAQSGQPATARAAVPELLRHGDFVRQLARQCEGRAAFTLVLVRLCDTPNSHATKTTDSSAHSHSDSPHDSDTRMMLLHLLCRHTWEASASPHGGAQEEAKASSTSGTAPAPSAPPLLAARYGQSSLIFLHAHSSQHGAHSTHSTRGEQTIQAAHFYAELYARLTREAAAQGLDVAVGIASWPHLRFTRADMPECCRKALDLALLLPQPRVGVFGSLALHISADKRYSRGDIFGAVEEYRLALLDDRNNSMAWNSLGVCMAALSRPQEARGHFLKALQGWKRAQRQPDLPIPFLPADTTLAAEYAATLYNLGTVCQTLGERRAAARHFRQCVDLQPDHYFALLRLGQLAEEGERASKARAYYEGALALELHGENGTSGTAGQHRGGMARRHLARLAVRGRKFREARELLHEALLHDPQDAAAMGMLAELCLDGGEDPSMAEMLARNCLSLRPGHAPSWKLLARALRALGRQPEADAADARAEGI